MSAPPITLLQFPFSHFNEKARWALDWKGLPHRRIGYLPGPHAPQILWISGQPEVPVVRFGKEVVAGSARIIDELERRFPSPALYPQEPAQCARALEIQQHFDSEVGPKVRRALFSVAIDEGDWTCAVFSTGKSAPMRALYRAMFPLTQQIMVRSMNLRDRAAIDDSIEATTRALDFVAKETQATGYLVGDAFSVADLTAAALLVVLVQPDHPDMRRPEPIPPRVQEFLSRWASHPGTAWVLDQYRRHRPPSQAI